MTLVADALTSENLRAEDVATEVMATGERLAIESGCCATFRVADPEYETATINTGTYEEGFVPACSINEHKVMFEHGGNQDVAVFRQVQYWFSFPREGSVDVTVIDNIAATFKGERHYDPIPLGEYEGESFSFDSLDELPPEAAKALSAIRIWLPSLELDQMTSCG